MNLRLERFRLKALGAVIWVVLAVAGTLIDGITWGWMLGFLRRPQIFNEYPILLGLLHIGVTILIAVPILILIRDREEKWFWFINAVVVTGLMPSIGAAFTGGALIVSPSPSKGEYEDEAEQLATGFERRRHHRGMIDESQTLMEKREDEEREYERIRRAWLDIEPLEDIVISPDFIRKRNALSKMARQPSRQNIRLLRICLTDNNPEIQFSAASALGRIEEEITKSLSDMQNQLNEHPEDQELRRRLIRHYLWSASLDLLPTESSRHYLRTALGLTDEVDEPTVQRELKARVLAALERHEELLDILGENQDLPEELAALRADALLKLGRYRELQAYCREQYDHPMEDDNIRQAFAFWTDEPTPATD